MEPQERPSRQAGAPVPWTCPSRQSTGLAEEKGKLRQPCPAGNSRIPLNVSAQASRPCGPRGPAQACGPEPLPCTPEWTRTVTAAVKQKSSASERRVWDVWKRQNYRDREKISGVQGESAESRALTCSRSHLHPMREQPCPPSTATETHHGQKLIRK